MYTCILRVLTISWLLLYVHVFQTIGTFRMVSVFLFYIVLAWVTRIVMAVSECMCTCTYCTWVRYCTYTRLHILIAQLKSSLSALLAYRSRQMLWCWTLLMCTVLLWCASFRCNTQLFVFNSCGLKCHGNQQGLQVQYIVCGATTIAMIHCLLGRKREMYTYMYVYSSQWYWGCMEHSGLPCSWLCTMYICNEALIDIVYL